jgi:hypothetical protein
VFEKYRQLSNANNFQDLCFYRVTENLIYPLERSEIIVVSAVQIPKLTPFIPADEPPCLRNEIDGNATWQWSCQGFQAYQDNQTRDYYQLEFVFVFAAQEDGEFPNFSFTVGIDPKPDIECLATSSQHENASICIPFQNRWNDQRKGLTCKMVPNPGGRSSVRRRKLAQALQHHGLNSHNDWSDVNNAIREAGGCNNPRFVEHDAGSGVQTAVFAKKKLKKFLLLYKYQTLNLQYQGICLSLLRQVNQIT